MFGFVFRKTFYDLWDNFLRIALTNLGALGIAFGGVHLVLSAPGDALTLAALALSSFVCTLYVTVAAKSAARISDYERYSFLQFWKNLPSSWRPALLCWALFALCAAITALVIPFYLRRGSMFWFAVAVVLFYVLVFLGILLVFLPAGLTRLEGGHLRRLRRTAAFVCDNLGFCFAASLAAAALLGASALLGFLWPGPTGALLFIDEALRLRLLKYDYLIANPGTSPKQKIPWKQILEAEREMTGTRTWRNFIFPWKD